MCFGALCTVAALLGLRYMNDTLQLINITELWQIMDSRLLRLCFFALLCFAATAFLFLAANLIWKYDIFKKKGFVWAFLICAAIVFGVMSASLSTKAGVTKNIENRNTENILPFTAAAFDAQKVSPQLYMLEYLKGKQLVIRTEQGDPIVNQLTADFSSARIEEPFVLEEYQEQFLYAQANKSFDDKTYITSGDWAASDDVIVVKNRQQGYFFIPQTTFDRMTSSPGISGVQVEAGSGFEETLLKQYNWLGGQTLLMVLLYLFGTLILFAASRKNTVLTTVLAFPIGAAAAALEMTLMCLLGIKVSALTVGICLGATAMVCIMACVRRGITGKELVMPAIGLAVIGLLAFALILKGNYYLSYDSAFMVLLGDKLSVTGTLGGMLSIYVSYGFVSAMLSALGYLYGCGVPYAVYPLFFCCTAAASGVLCYYIADPSKESSCISKKSCIPAYIACGVVSLLVAAFVEYQYHITWVLNNSIVAFFVLLIFCSSVLLDREKGENFTFLLLIGLIMLMITRTEGGVFAAFFLIAAQLLHIDKNKLLRCSVICLAVTAVFHAICYLRIEDSTVFWNPMNAVICCFALGCASVISFIFAKTKLWKILQPYLRWLWFLAVIAVFVVSGLLAQDGVPINNARTIFAHMTSIEWISMTSLILVLGIAAVAAKANHWDYAAFCILGFILLLFSITMFRMVEGEIRLLRIGYGDSARRILFQLVPGAVTLLASGILEKLFVSDKAR